MAEHTLTFHTAHDPPLADGVYKVSVSQKVKGKDLDDSFASQELAFRVAGPKYHLAPNEIFKVYPPQGKTGDYRGVIPSVQFKRSTLPWERNPKLEASETKDEAWLALLLVDESEHKLLTEHAGKELKELKEKLKSVEPSNSDAKYYPDDSKAGYLELDKSLEFLLPTYKDLAYLSHARVDSEEGVEHGVVLGNRLPTSGKKNTVYVISLEYRYDKDGKFRPGDGDKIVFPFLYKWTFSALDDHAYLVNTKAIERLGGEKQERLEEMKTRFFPHKELFEAALKEAKIDDSSQEEGYKTAPITDKKLIKEIEKVCAHKSASFEGMLLKLAHGQFKPFRAKGTTLSKGKPQLDRGCAAVQHFLRKQDKKTISWYQGPFMSSQRTYKSLPEEVSCSDQLLIYDKLSGMLETSYAAAWELGRLMTLTDKHFSVDFFKWKHELAMYQRSEALKKTENYPSAGHLALTKKSPPSAELPKHLTDKIEDWKSLHRIPFNYLVPRPELLPMESIRYFHLDNTWINAFLKGVFNIGETPPVDISKAWEESKMTEQVTGILLRSEVVSGWPNLQVDGYVEDLDWGDFEDNTPMEKYRIEKLSTNVLLVLFKGIVKTLDIHLKRNTLHSGLDYEVEVNEDQEESLKFYKPLRNLKKGDHTGEFLSPEKSVEVRVRGEDEEDEKMKKEMKRKQVIDIASLATTIGEIDSAQFGLAMMEGTQLVRFRILS